MNDFSRRRWATNVENMQQRFHNLDRGLSQDLETAAPMVQGVDDLGTNKLMAFSLSYATWWNVSAHDEAQIAGVILSRLESLIVVDAKRRTKNQSVRDPSIASQVTTACR